MDTTTVYAICIGSVLLLWVFLTIGLGTILRFYFYLAFYVTKHLSNRQLPRLLRGHASISRADLALCCVYIAGNIIATFLGGSSLQSVERRAGHLALINMASLILLGRPNMLSSSCRVSQRRQEQLHAVIGCMVMVHALTHSAIALSQNQRSIPGYIASGGTICLCVFMTGFFRRMAFEGARVLHIMVAITVIAALFIHILHAAPDHIQPKVYTLLVAGFWAVILIMRMVFIAYRSFGTRGYIFGYEEDDEIVQLVVDLRKPWDLGPGQFAYITIPTISSSACFQSHPFQLVWWDQTLGRAFFLVAPRKGFTRNLLHHRSAWIKNKSTMMSYTDGTALISNATPVKAIIEGPYGKFEDLGSYGTVLMVATGLGIAAQLPYIRYLLEAHRNREVRTQKICLFWQVRKEQQRHWVSQWMSDLMKDDTQHVLSVHIFITKSDPPKNRNDTPGRHDALKVHWRGASFSDVLGERISKQTGKIVVTVSADKGTKEKIRKTMEEKWRKGIELKEWDFEPAW